MDGWIKIYRKIVESEMYQSLDSKQRDVMFQCLLLANHSNKKWEWGGELFECKPGQFITSLSKIKKRCAKDVSIKNIRTGLLKLKKWKFLAIKSAKTGRLITICNWETYQGNGQSTGQSIGPTGGKEAATNKNNKEYKEVLFGHFQEFWNRYPKKIKKKDTEQKFLNLKVEEAEKILQVLSEWLNIYGRELKFTPAPNVFINQRRWEDELTSNIEHGESSEESKQRFIHDNGMLFGKLDDSYSI